MEDIWNGIERRALQKKRQRDPRPLRAPSPFPTWPKTTKKLKDLAVEASKKADQFKTGGKGGLFRRREKWGLAVGGSLAGGGVVEFDVAGGAGGKGREESVDVGTVDAILGEGSVWTEVVEVILGSYMNTEHGKEQEGKRKGIFFLLLYVCVTEKTREHEREENK